MAKRTWIGGDIVVAQVETFQVTGADAGTTYQLEVTDEGGTLEVTIQGAGDAAVNTCASNLSTAWNASVHPLASGITASVSTDTVTLTADVPGVPFYVAGSVSGGAGTIGAGTVATASRGPNDWNDPFNWKEGEIPVSGSPGDDVILTGSVAIKYGLDQSGVNTLGQFTAVPGSASEIGNEAFWLQIDPTTFIWWGKGTSYIDTGATLQGSAHEIWDTARPGLPGQSGLYIKHNDTLREIIIYGGSVGIGVSGGDTAVFKTIFMYNGDLIVGDEVSTTNYRQYGGTASLASSTGTMTMDGGTCTVIGNSVIGPLTIEEGTLIAKNSGGAINDIALNGGTLDLSQNPQGAATLDVGTTNFNVKPGATLIVDPTWVTWTKLPNPSEKMRISFTDA